MKAWVVTDKFVDGPTLWCYLLDDDRDRAKYRAQFYDESQTIQDNRLFPRELLVHRKAELDGDGITIAQLLAAGHLGWADCAGCHEMQRIPHDGPHGLYVHEGNIYCSQACAAQHPRPPYPPVQGICLYQDW